MRKLKGDPFQIMLHSKLTFRFKNNHFFQIICYHVEFHVDMWEGGLLHPREDLVCCSHPFLLNDIHLLVVAHEPLNAHMETAEYNHMLDFYVPRDFQ